VNNYRFGDYLHLIYPKCIEIKILLTLKNTASFLDLHLEIGYGKRLKTKLYDKHYDFTFAIVNFPFVSSNISTTAAYGVNISQLILYSRVFV
jgi:hypothetical protein